MVLIFQLVMLLFGTALFAGVGVITGLPFWLLFRGRRWALPVALGLWPLLLAMIPGVWMIGGVSATLLASPVQLYARVFGAEPGPAVRRLNAHQDMAADAVDVLLAFDRSPAALSGALSRLAFEPRPNLDPRRGWPYPVGDTADPPWWRVGACPDPVVYLYESHRHARPQVRAYWNHVRLIDCPAQGRIYVDARRVD